MAEFNPLTADANLKSLATADQNPLQQYFRQPKVYTTLPSRGKFYPEGSLNIPETGEFPVFAMTAKDELTMKTPDALLNGAATVNVIKSCVPDIIDPWQLPSIDLDAVLIAIRIATYGDSLDMETKQPVTGEDKTFSVDLRQLLNTLVTAEYDSLLEIGDFKLELRPLNYKEFTQTSLKTFEEQRIFNTVNDDELPDADKLQKFAESFEKLTDITVSMMANGISKISIGDTEVTNPVHISEFIDNVDKDVYQAILDHLEIQKDKFSIKPLEITSTEEDIKAGVPETWSVPITFDQSNFFE